MGHPVHLQVAAGRRPPVLLCLLLALAGALPACSLLSRERLVYDEGGIEIGIEHDKSTSQSAPAVLNSHPARLTPDELRLLLSSIYVGGWTGVVGGLLKDPSPIPLFTETELRVVVQPLAAALSQAGPEERVFFSVPNQTVRYITDATAGSLFIRGPYLHLTLQDHSALLRTDTAGGEDYKDPRDFKGMHLWVARPARAATPTPNEQPAWGPFEPVHISMNVRDSLTPRAAPATPAIPLGPIPLVPSKEGAGQPVQQPAAQKAPPTASAAAESADDQRLLLRELAATNLELRSRLKEQAQDLQSLKDELARMRQELDRAKTKAKPRPKSPSP